MNGVVLPGNRWIYSREINRKEPGDTIRIEFMNRNGEKIRMVIPEASRGTLKRYNRKGSDSGSETLPRRGSESSCARIPLRR